jgi:hypothetical protein
MTEDIAEAIKEMGDWNEAALLDRIVVWDRWIEKGIAPDGTKEARDAATQIIIERVNRLRAQRDELQDSFDMRWKADMRAIKKWQAANQGNDLVWPDHADLVVWLMAGRDRLRNLLSLAEGKLSDGRLYVGYGNVGPLHDYATASIIQRARAALKETGDG